MVICFIVWLLTAERDSICERIQEKDRYDAMKEELRAQHEMEVNALQDNLNRLQTVGMIISPFRFKSRDQMAPQVAALTAGLSARAVDIDLSVFN